MTQLSDAEIVCSFMEPKPDAARVENDWWTDEIQLIRGEHRSEVVPVDLTLDRLWLVEEQLDDQLWYDYCLSLDGLIGYKVTTTSLFRSYVHVSAEQKIKALAAILRPLVEKEGSQ